MPTSPPDAACERPGDSPTPAQLLQRLGESRSPLRVLVETTTLTIADGQPAIGHIDAAIDAGCHVVTANKGPVAFAYRRLRAWPAGAGVSFLFEGVVMDGVPVFNLVRETMPGVTVRGFRGVVNSTTNHILTALESGEAFAPALARMQAEGIAEADASLDVDGWDAAAKAAALANVLMDGELTPHLVHRTGIGPESATQAQEARRLRGSPPARGISGARQSRQRHRDSPAGGVAAGGFVERPSRHSQRLGPPHRPARRRSDPSAWEWIDDDRLRAARRSDRD